MEDAAVYRHWTDAELELLADRSLAAADVAAATGRPRRRPGGRHRSKSACAPDTAPKTCQCLTPVFRAIPLTCSGW